MKRARFELAIRNKGAAWRLERLYWIMISVMLRTLVRDVVIHLDFGVAKHTSSRALRKPLRNHARES